MNHSQPPPSAMKPQHKGSARSILRETPPSAYLEDYQQGPRRRALILDASHPSPSPHVSFVSNDSTPHKNRVRFFPPSAPHGAYRLPVHSPAYETPVGFSQPEATAADIAREAPQAGFLLKLGANVPQFKRRFFVLQPRTHLYYFLSPNDDGPRGCLDLDGSWVEDGGEWSDGKYRFAICWSEHQKVVFEARSKTVAEEWMQALKTQRLSYSQGELDKAKRKHSAYQSRIAELEQQVEHYKLVEKDRDGALEDAARWKAEFEQLDESIRKLTQRLRRPRAAATGKKEAVTTATVLGSDESDYEEKKVDDSGEATSKDASREHSLLDEAMELEGEMDVLHVPGAHFGSLYNTCEQLSENLRLASEEAASAVEDLHAANQRVEVIEKRVGKAEKHLCKIWEENCALRKTVKQKKRERRVLVREVKNLRDAADAHQRAAEWSTDDVKPRNDASSVNASDDEEKLIDELEEHVLSSIRLHEQLLGNGATARTARPDDISVSFNSEFVDIAAATATLQPLKMQMNLPVASLLDESDDEESEAADLGSVGPSFSSVNVEASDGESRSLDKEAIALTEVCLESLSPASTPERPNPLLQLDEDGDQPQLCAASSQSGSSKSVLTRDLAATARLVCPLADVVSPLARNKKLLTEGKDELHVYHLTFYTRKIGIQFQKVPPPPIKPKGLLTDAMTADLATKRPGSTTTASELRRIAAISTQAKSDQENEDACPVATPVDAVVVCGFVGFDCSGANVRPRLGARLVAFDGVSVEVGLWTFDSIRKAIQARGRPLTLSFRNDFLTTHQREILTKAVKDVESTMLSRLRTPQYSVRRRPSMDPSVHSALSHDSSEQLNGAAYTHRSQEDDGSLSVASDGRVSLPQSFSGAKSVVSVNFRSFSEAGSTTSMLSAVGPLVSNLLSRNNEPFTPGYMTRPAESVEDTPQHQDFKAELL